TQRKHTEEVLRTAEEKFRLVVEATPNAIVLVNGEGKILLVNAQAEKLFGYPRQELLGQPVELLVPERFRANHPAWRTAFLAVPEARPIGAGRDLYGRRKDGSEIPVEIRLNPIRTDDGLMVLSAIADITERKRAEAALRRSEQRFRMIFEQAAVGVALVENETGRFLRINRKYCDLLGYSTEEMTGRTFQEITHPDDRQAHLDYMQ